MLCSSEREDISKNTIAKKCERCFLVFAMRSPKEEEIEEMGEGDTRRSTRLKCVWCNYTSFAAHKTFIFVAR